MKKNRISIIGAGNLAHSLLPAILNAGYKVDFVLSKSGKSAQDLARKHAIKHTQDINRIDSEVIIISTSDHAIQSIARSIESNKNQIIIHTSGSTALSSISETHQNTGVLYPLQTFSKNRIVPLREIPICIEASNAKTIKIVNQLASQLSEKVVKLNSNQRLQLHLAAVFACNFTNLLYTISNDILEANQIDFSLLHPLISETAKKAIASKPQNVQTGPALRNDMITLEKHKKMLAGEQLKMYDLLTNWIKNRYIDKGNA